RDERGCPPARRWEGPEPERTAVREDEGGARQRSWRAPQPSPPLEHPAPHSHSMVPGGFDVMSYTTRFTPRTSLMIRDETRPRSSYGSGTQSAVMPSSECTARTATTSSYVRASPMTPTERTGSSTANACQI